MSQWCLMTGSHFVSTEPVWQQDHYAVCRCGWRSRRLSFTQAQRAGGMHIKEARSDGTFQNRQSSEAG